MPHPRALPPHVREGMTAEITALLNKGVIEPTADHPRRQAPAKTWLRFLGYLSSLVDVLPDCRLLMRPLRLFFLRNYRPGRDPLSVLILMIDGESPGVLSGRCSLPRADSLSKMTRA